MIKAQRLISFFLCFQALYLRSQDHLTYPTYYQVPVLATKKSNNILYGYTFAMLYNLLGEEHVLKSQFTSIRNAEMLTFI